MIIPIVCITTNELDSSIGSSLIPLFLSAVLHCHALFLLLPFNLHRSNLGKLSGVG